MDGMGYYEPQNDWMWEVAGFLIACGAAIFIVNWILRKILGVERKKLFSPSSNYVNDRHQKVDAYFRYGGAVVSVIAVLIFYKDGLWVPLTAMLVIGVIQELYTAFMEKQHSDNPNDYLFTLLQLPSSLIILFVCAEAFLPGFIEMLFNRFH